MGQTLEFFSGVGDEEKMFYNLIVVRKLPRVADLCQRGSNAKTLFFGSEAPSREPLLKWKAQYSSCNN